MKIIYTYLLELCFLNNEFLSVYSGKIEKNGIFMTASYLHPHNYN